ncbi:MAG: hypothetical protein IT299_13250 [Dehalococcoidia bacterium]|nr:hypothetical protein [Dehalococcoidia bacterium]
MRTHATRIRATLTALVAMGLLALAMANAGTIAQAQTPSPTGTAAPLAACPTANQLLVAPPTAAAPTTVTTSIAPPLGNLKAATQGDRASLHLHYFIDTPPPAAGTTIPMGPSIIHTAALTQDLGALSAGAHTVYVVVGQLDHRACALRGQVSFNVGAASASATQPTSPVTPPKTGSGGLLPGAASASSWLGLATLAVAALGIAGGAVVARRRR